MRDHKLLLILLVACVLSAAWGIPCDDGNSNVGDGCNSNEVEPGFVCPATGKCFQTSGIARYNAIDGISSDDLRLQTNFMYGIFDNSQQVGFWGINAGDVYGYQDSSTSSLPTYNLNLDGADTTNPTGYATFASGNYLFKPTTHADNNQDNSGGNIFSVCLWTKPTLSSTVTRLVTIGSSASFYIRKSATNFVEVGFGSAAPIVTSSAALTGAWQHVCVTVDSSTSTNNVNLYVNTGSLVQASATQSSLALTDDKVYIGADATPTGTYAGSLYDVRVYTVALPAASITTIYNEGKTYVSDSTAGANNPASFPLVTPWCGDGNLDPNEECDDNNLINGDGCDWLCRKEDDYECIGSPSVCYRDIVDNSGAYYYAYTSNEIGQQNLVDDYYDFLGFYRKSEVISVLQVDASGLTGDWTPPASELLKSRVGQTTYSFQRNAIGKQSTTLPFDIKSFGVYNVEIIFVEMEATGPGQRVFDVEANGITPSWSPIDVWASAGGANVAIKRSFRVIASLSSRIILHFNGNATVSAIRVTPAPYGVASFDPTLSPSTDLAVAGSGTHDYYNPLFGYPEFTMEAFVYLKKITVGQTNYILKKGNDFSLFVTSAGFFGCTIGSVSGELLEGTIGLQLDTWYHVACVAQGASNIKRLYVNGVLDKQMAIATTWSAPTTAKVVFGHDLDGYLDSVRLWERALSAGEVAHNSRSAASTPINFGLLTEWSFDDVANEFPSATRVRGPQFVGGIAVPSISIACGGITPTAGSLTIADSFFVGGTSTATGRQGEFAYTFTGLPMLQSYKLTLTFVAPTSTTPFNAYINQVQAATMIVGQSTYTTNVQSDYSGQIYLNVTGSATLAAISIVGVQAPLGWTQYATASASSEGGSLQTITHTALKDLTITDTTSAHYIASGFRAQGNSPSAPGTAPDTGMPISYRVGQDPVSSAIVYSASVDIAFKFPNLLAGQLYNVRVDIMEVDPTAVTLIGSNPNSGQTSQRSFSILMNGQTYDYAAPKPIADGLGALAQNQILAYGVPDANGDLTVTLKGCSTSATGANLPGCIVNAIQIFPGPLVTLERPLTIPKPSTNLPDFGAIMTIAGSNFLLDTTTDLVNMLFYDSATAATPYLVNIDANAYVYFEGIEIDYNNYNPGPLYAELVIYNNGAANEVRGPRFYLGYVGEHGYITPSEDYIASNSEMILIYGSFPTIDNLLIVQSPTATAPATSPDGLITVTPCSLSDPSNLPPLTPTRPLCEPISWTNSSIMCKPHFPLTPGPLYLSTTVYATSCSAIQKVGNVVASPSLTSVTGTVTVIASGIILNGKNFISVPEHSYNAVELIQGGVISTCSIITATTKMITCAPSNLVAGPLAIRVLTAGGVSNTITVTVAAAPTSGACLPPVGIPDMFDSTLCNCFSGYAPSNNYFKDCLEHPTCVRNTVASDTTAPRFQAPVTAFKDDHLTIKQTVPIVTNRRDTNIRFSVPVNFTNIVPSTMAAGSLGSLACAYPGNLWTKKIDAFNCLDEYSAIIPWTGHTLCGFVYDNKTSNASYAVYAAQIDSSYITSHLVDGSYVQRASVDSYLISVGFRRTLTITTEVVTEISDAGADGFISVAVDNSNYDPSTHKMTVWLLAQTKWPYMIDITQVVAGVFTSDNDAISANIVASVTGEEQVIDVHSAQCTTVDDSICSQTIVATFAISNNSLCNIAGSYKFANTPLLCRDLGAVGLTCPVTSSATLLFEVGTTNLCEAEAVDPSEAIQPTMTAWEDPNADGPETNFYSNDVVHFAFNIEADQVSIDSVTFNHIEVTNTRTNGADLLYDITQTPAKRIAPVNLTLVEITTLVPAGQAAIAWFSFKLSHQYLLNTVQVAALANEILPAPLQITATADISFHGNKESRKRTVSFDMNSAVKSAVHAITFHAKDRNSNSINDNNNNNLNNNQNNNNNNQNNMQNNAAENNNNNKQPQQPPQIDLGVNNDIWDDLSAPPAQASELDNWFSTLESSGEKLMMSSLVIMMTSLFVHIIFA